MKKGSYIYYTEWLRDVDALIHTQVKQSACCIYRLKSKVQMPMVEITCQKPLCSTSYNTIIVGNGSFLCVYNIHVNRRV